MIRFIIEIPNKSDLEKVLKYVGINKVVLNYPFIKKMHPNTKIDLNAIAKGHVKPITTSAALSGVDMAITLEAMASSLLLWTQQLHSAALFAADPRIISYTSEGSHKAWKHYAAVGAAKAALEAITRSIALEFAPFGIRAKQLEQQCIEHATFELGHHSHIILSYKWQQII